MYPSSASREKKPNHHRSSSGLHLVASLSLIVILSSILISQAKSCAVETCSREYADLITNQAVRANDGQQQEHQQRHHKHRGAPTSFNVENRRSSGYCSILSLYHQCLRTLSRTCRGNLDYHSVLSLVRQWIGQNNCSGEERPKSKVPQIVRAGPDLAKLREQQEIRRRQQQEKRRFNRCRRDAFAYTLDKEAFLLRMRKEDQRMWDLDREDSSMTFKQLRGSRMTRNSDDLLDASSIETGPDEDESDSKEASKPITSLGNEPYFEEGGEDQTSQIIDSPLTCLIYGDPHLRTLNREFQTCRCQGAWPLIDHPLFAIQITNSVFKNRIQSTGITKVTVMVREFKRCGVTTDMMYEAESKHDKQPDVSLPVTFNDGSTSSLNNLVQIDPSSQDLVSLHLKHIGVQIIVSQSKDSDYLNIVVKFDEKLSGEQQLQVINAISDNSLCKMGCPRRERVEIKGLLEAIGLDVQAAEQEELLNLAANGTSSDPCSGLYGYYRISCLYDVKMKGITHEDASVHRLIQSYDDSSVAKRSFVDSLRSPGKVHSRFSRENQNSFASQLSLSFICKFIFMVFLSVKM